MTFRVLLPALLAPLLLGACVGGTLSDTSEFEMFPLRAATAKEHKELKRCLKAAHSAQQAHAKKTGKYYRRAKDLPVESECNGILLKQKGTTEGYEILGEIHEDETSVRWSVNEKGLIEEHLDNEGNEDLEL